MGNSNSGRGGLPRGVRGQIERLLVGGWSQKEVARFVGVDPKTVWRIAKKMRTHSTAEPVSGSSRVEHEAVDDGPLRCGSCGGLLEVGVLSCLACYLRRHDRA